MVLVATSYGVSDIHMSACQMSCMSPGKKNDGPPPPLSFRVINQSFFDDKNWISQPKRALTIGLLYELCHCSHFYDLSLSSGWDMNILPGSWLASNTKLAAYFYLTYTRGDASVMAVAVSHLRTVGSDARRRYWCIFSLE